MTRESREKISPGQVLRVMFRRWEFWAAVACGVVLIVLLETVLLPENWPSDLGIVIGVSFSTFIWVPILLRRVAKVTDGIGDPPRRTEDEPTIGH